jgi:hypothetical protein
MIGKKLIALMLSVGLSTQVLANNSTVVTEEKDFVKSMRKHSPDSISEAIVLDGLLAMLFAQQGLMPKKLVPIYTVASALSYIPRKACREYLFDGQHSKFCGLVGGTIKYGSRTLVMGKGAGAVALTAARGAVNAFLYEATGDVADAAYEKSERSVYYPLYAAIEGFDGYLETVVNIALAAKGAQLAARNEMSTNIKYGVIAGILLSLDVDFVYPLIAKPIADLASYLSPFAYFESSELSEAKNETKEEL